MLEINNNLLSILKYRDDNNKSTEKDSNNQQINKENKNKKNSLNDKNKNISDNEEDESEDNTSNISSDNITINKKNNRTDNQKLTLTDKQKKIKREIFNIEYEESDKKTYKYTFNKIHWNTLTISYNCADYMCDTLLLVSYEYKDNNRDSLKIKSINIKKEHSIDRKDHN